MLIALGHAAVLCAADGEAKSGGIDCTTAGGCVRKGSAMRDRWVFGEALGGRYTQQKQCLAEQRDEINV